ncbi:polyprenyl synthetase family protein [Candidatus Woesearchaeota archaeon]|nr:polyprenyl synthetase family protein [Candidatus Woesearchaeota archaeon]
MEFIQAVGQYKGIVNKTLSTFFDNHINKTQDGFLKFNYSTLRDYVLRDGKRLRPITLIMAYKSITDNDEQKIYMPSLSMELFHASSLIHDDIMDEDDLRRGKESMHTLFNQWFVDNHGQAGYNGPIFNQLSTKFGVSMAILQGNILIALGESCLSGSSFAPEQIKAALMVCNNTNKVVNEGQIQDIVLETKREFTENDYLSMIAKKTGKLFSTSLEIGAVFAGATDSQRKALDNYALSAATTFQIQDDIMDISPDMKKGHEVGSDIKQGKRTLLVMKALEKGDEGQKKVLFDALGNEKATPEEIEIAIDVMHATGAVDYAKNLAADMIKKGKDALKEADPALSSDGLKFFNDLADYMVNRNV